MNVGMVSLALMLVCGSILGIFAIAQANQVLFQDTFGVGTPIATNNSRTIIFNATAATMPAAGGIAVLFAIVLVFIGAVWIARAVSKQNSYSSARGRY